MRQGESYPYAIIRHNPLTCEGSTEVAVVRGENAPAQAIDRFNGLLATGEKEAGWRHFAQRTTQKPWPKPRRATMNYKPRVFEKI